jgi:molecular chaperone GrpE
VNAGGADRPLDADMTDQQQSDIHVVDRRWWARGETGAGAANDEPFDKPTYVQELEARMAAKDEELRATLARYREANAEFEQARARMRRDVAKEVERGARAVLADLLDVIDNLDRAIAAARTAGSDPALLQGIELVRAQFLAKLDGHGVRPLDAAGRRFDPSCHEAAATVPVTDPAQDGTVVGVIRQGYMIRDEVLRPAVVAVAAFDNQGGPS